MTRNIYIEMLIIAYFFKAKYDDKVYYTENYG